MNSRWTRKRLSMFWSQVAHWSGAFALNAALCNCIRKKFVENERIPQGCKCSLFRFVSVPCNSGTQKRHLVQYYMMFFILTLLPPGSHLVILLTVIQLLLLVKRIWYWINSYFPFISSLVCLMLCWYCKKKFCLGHSWEWKGWYWL